MALAALPAAAGAQSAPAHHYLYIPAAVENHITIDTQRLSGSAESHTFNPAPRQRALALRQPLLETSLDHEREPLSAPQWEMLYFCRDHGFFPEVQECPKGWRYVRVDVSP